MTTGRWVRCAQLCGLRAPRGGASTLGRLGTCSGLSLTRSNPTNMKHRLSSGNVIINRSWSWTITFLWTILQTIDYSGLLGFNHPFQCRLRSLILINFSHPRWRVVVHACKKFSLSLSLHVLAGAQAILEVMNFLVAKNNQKLLGWFKSILWEPTVVPHAFQLEVQPCNPCKLGFVSTCWRISWICSGRSPLGGHDEPGWSRW